MSIFFDLLQFSVESHTNDSVSLTASLEKTGIFNVLGSNSYSDQISNGR